MIGPVCKLPVAGRPKAGSELQLVEENSQGTGAERGSRWRMMGAGGEREGEKRGAPARKRHVGNKADQRSACTMQTCTGVGG